MVISLKKRYVITAVIAAVLIALVFILSGFGSESPSNSAVVVLDAGHGGADGGATGVQTKVKESDINLKITLYLKELFEKAGIRVVLTRKDENGLYGELSNGFKSRDMAARKKIAEESGCNLMISVHLNKFRDPSVRGAQVFFDPGSVEGRELARLIQNALNKDVNPAARTEHVGDYYILRAASAASVIAECGFLSSPEDEALLITAAHQKKLAQAIFSGALQYLTTQTVQEYLP